jgi:hypothetical protein
MRRQKGTAVHNSDQPMNLRAGGERGELLPANEKRSQETPPEQITRRSRGVVPMQEAPSLQRFRSLFDHSPAQLFGKVVTETHLDRWRRQRVLRSRVRIPPAMQIAVAQRVERKSAVADFSPVITLSLRGLFPPRSNSTLAGGAGNGYFADVECLHRLPLPLVPRP